MIDKYMIFMKTSLVIPFTSTPRSVVDELVFEKRAK